MSVFVDTAALLALLDAGDADHDRVASAFDRLLRDGTPLLTTSYVLVETAAVAQRRLGVAAVRAVEERLRPLLDVTWVDEALHRSATTALLAAARRGVSLVDWVSFEAMRRARVDVAFTLEGDFREQGFATIP